MKTYFIATLLLLICSCRIGDETITLSGHSLYHAGGLDNRRIFTNTAFHKTAIYPDIVGYDYNDNFIIVKQKPSATKYVTPYLGFDLYHQYTVYHKYMFGKDNIKPQEGVDVGDVVKRDSANYRIFHSKGASQGNTQEDIMISQAVADSLIHNDPYYIKIYSRKENYWIIINALDTLIGPLTKEEFLIKRKEYHVPDKLTLE